MPIIAGMHIGLSKASSPQNPPAMATGMMDMMLMG